MNWYRFTFVFSEEVTQEFFQLDQWEVRANNEQEAVELFRGYCRRFANNFSWVCKKFDPEKEKEEHFAKLLAGNFRSEIDTLEA